MVWSRRRRWCELAVREPAIALIGLHRQSRRTRVELSRWIVEQRLVTTEGKDIARQVGVTEQRLSCVDVVDVVWC